MKNKEELNQGQTRAANFRHCDRSNSWFGGNCDCGADWRVGDLCAE